jgi:hypothetical protein
MAVATLRHRITRSFEAESDEIGPDRVVEDILMHVTPDAEEVFR